MEFYEYRSYSIKRRDSNKHRVSKVETRNDLCPERFM